MNQSDRPNPNGDVVIHDGSDVGDLALKSMIADLDSGRDSGEVKPEIKEGGEGGAGNTPEAGKANPEDVPEGTKPEEKPTEKKEGGEPFAVVGDRIFKSREEFVNEFSKVNGYNRFITGHLKRVHPDWFDDKGQLSSKKLQEAAKSLEKTGEQAAQVVEGKQVNLSDEEQSAVISFLRGQGFMTEAQAREMVDEALASREGNSAIETEVEKLFTAHPELETNPEFADEFAELIEKEGEIPESYRRTPEELWKFFAGKKGIATTTPQEDADKVDNLIPSSVQRSGGLPPSQKSGDIFDQLLGSKGM